MSSKISLETTVEAFRELEDEWNDLAERMDCPEIFHRWEWAWLCHKHFRQDAELLILTVRDRGRLVALAPFCIVRRRASGLAVRIVETIVTGHADYGNLLICRSQHRRRVVRAILKWLYAKSAEWDLIDLSQLSSRDATSLHLAMTATEFPELRSVTRVVARTPLLGYATYPEKCNEKQVHWIKNRARKLARDGFTLTVGTEARDDLWVTFCDLHGARWTNGPFRAPSVAAFYDELRRDLGSRGLVEFSYLAQSGRPVAMHFGFRDARKIYFYMPVADENFRSQRVGAVLANAIVEHYATSHQQLEFLRGDEDYKYWWTDDVAANFRLLIFRRDNVAALAYNAMPALGEFVGSLAFPGLVRQRIKDAWGRLRAGPAVT